MSDGDFQLIGYGDHALAAMQDYEDQCHEEYQTYLDWQYLEESMNADRFKADPKMWEDIMADMETQTEGDYFFPQAGKSPVRLLLAPDLELGSFYVPVLRSFKGKERLQYMFPVLVGDSKGIYSNNIKIACVAKTVFGGILNLLAEKWDLFSPEWGHGVIINRAGEGLKTTYTVTVTPDPIPVDYSILDWEQPLDEYRQRLEASDREGEEEILFDDDCPF